MNWDDMRIFLAVARSGSVSGAARTLDVQHSTVSRRLQQLEKKLRVRLLDKKRSGYVLTSAGEDLRDAALRMEREMLAVDGTIPGQDQDLCGTLRVTTVVNIAYSFLIPMLARFNEQYPNITVQLTVSNANISLPEREADVAIRVTKTPSGTLMGKKLARIASTAYGSKSYLARIKSKKEKPQWIGVTCCGYHKHWTKHWSNGEVSNFYSDEPIITQASLRQDLGLAILPCHMGDRDPELERYIKPPADMDMDLWMLYHPDLKRTARIRVFRDFIADEFNSIKTLLAGN